MGKRCEFLGCREAYWEMKFPKLGSVFVLGGVHALFVLVEVLSVNVSHIYLLTLS